MSLSALGLPPGFGRNGSSAALAAPPGCILLPASRVSPHRAIVNPMRPALLRPLPPPPPTHVPVPCCRPASLPPLPHPPTQPEFAPNDVVPLPFRPALAGARILQ